MSSILQWQPLLLLWRTGIHVHSSMPDLKLSQKLLFQIALRPFLVCKALHDMTKATAQTMIFLGLIVSYNRKGCFSEDTFCEHDVDFNLSCKHQSLPTPVLLSFLHRQEKWTTSFYLTARVAINKPSHTIPSYYIQSKIVDLTSVS